MAKSLPLYDDILEGRDTYNMKTVGFIGGYDKLDLMLYIARILTLAEKKVLLIDASLLQKTKYVIPAISPTQSYVTEFEGFDVAIRI